jgi:anthranilate phosphoribosyltransferase
MMDGIQLARQAIESGAARVKLDALIKLSGELAVQ